MFKWVLREPFTAVLAIDTLELADKLFELIGAHVGIDDLLTRSFAEPGARTRFLDLIERILEKLPLDPFGDRPVHHDKPTVHVECEPAVGGRLGQPLNRLVVQPEVEDRFHHAGHGAGGPGTNGDQQRIVGSPELLPTLPLELGKHLADLPFKARRPLAVLPVEYRACFGGNGKPRRNRESDTGHLRQARSLAT